MTPKQSQIYHIHTLSKSAWDKNREGCFEDLCHQLLQIQLQELSPAHPAVQNMLIKNCSMLAARKEYHTIRKLLEVIRISLQHDEEVLLGLSNRLRMMIA